MNSFQKILLLEKYNDDLLSQRATWDLMELLEKHGLEYYMLSIPVTELEIDRFINPACYSEFIREYNMKAFSSRTINFDIYIPALKWAFNINEYGKETPYTVKTAFDSICKCIDSVPSEERGTLMSGAMVLPGCTDLHTALHNGLTYYLNQRGISHPFDKHEVIRVAELSDQQTTFGEENLKRLDILLKKMKKGGDL